jgi:hypothetical protein
MPKASLPEGNEFCLARDPASDTYVLKIEDAVGLSSSPSAASGTILSGSRPRTKPAPNSYFA